MEEELDQLGQQADRLANLVAGFDLPLPAQMHLDQSKVILDEVATEIRKFVTLKLGYSPWDG